MFENILIVNRGDQSPNGGVTGGCRKHNLIAETIDV